MIEQIHEVSPIFVLGSARNGTTWLCNVLCRHPQIVGAQHEAHWGINESNIYKNMRYWGDFGEDRNFIKFMELYSSADYFRLVEGNKDYFYKNRPGDFPDFFLTLMDQFAEKKGAKYWVTKLDPFFYSHPKELMKFISLLNQRYRFYKFIGIKRDFPSALQSYLNMEGRASQHRNAPFIRQVATLLESARYTIHYKVIEQIVESKNGLLILFSEFKKHHNEKIHQIMDFLGLSYSSDMLKSHYNPNSSLTKKNQILVPKQEIFLGKKLFLPVFSRLPWVAKVLLKLRDKTRRRKCPLYWRLLRTQYMQNSFSDELKRTGDIGLHGILSAYYLAIDRVIDERRIR